MDIKIYHKNDCKMAFGRKDPTCPRCQELLNGAQARKGWNDDKLKADQQRSRAISEHYKNHDEHCDYAKRNAPCVAFDW